MTIARVVERVRDMHRGCCITTNCRERGCNLGLRGLDGRSMAIINGTLYQKNHNPPGKLCDRIILSSQYDGFVCAVELKGGSSQLRLSEPIDQIRGGLDVIERLLDGLPIGEWYPILAFSGRMGAESSAALRAKANLVRFGQESRQITKTDCNAQLAQVLRIGD